MKYKAIIFDVDGTLIDTEKSVIYSLQQVLSEMTYKEYSYDELYFALGIPGEKALTILGIEDRAPVLERWLDIHHSFSYMDTIFAGIRETIEILKEQNIALGVVTSRVQSEFDNFLNHHQFHGYFDAVSCAGDTARPKPAPDPLLAALEKLQVTPEEALYVGDSIYDMQCAASAGVDGALALWGACEPDKITSCYRLEKPEDILALEK